MAGITGYGTYVPRYRLTEADIAAVLGGKAGPRRRSVAAYDEDSISLGVEAARRVGLVPAAVDGLLFATASAPYLEKTNATIVHAALRLPERATAFDMVGSVRSGVGALRLALDGASAGRSTLVVLSDVRTGLPGSPDEIQGGDGATAILVGADGVIAEFLGSASTTAEFQERWRVAGDPQARVWEDRFGEEIYLPLARTAVAEALATCGLAAADVDRVVVAGLHQKATRRFSKELLASTGAAAGDTMVDLGNLGCGQVGLLLAATLDTAETGEVVLVVSLADGVDAMLFKTTSELQTYRTGRRTVRDQAEQPQLSVDYATFLTWRGMLQRQPPRRPDPQRPAPPPSHRRSSWKFGFAGSVCQVCGCRHLPPARVCQRCGAVDAMDEVPMADVPATISALTVDRLTFSLSPPVVAAAIDFEGGGRFQCEMADVDLPTMAVGDRVEMTFRRLFTADGIHNYFWKARSVPSSDSEGGS